MRLFSRDHHATLDATKLLLHLRLVKAPNFTTQNARQMQARAVIARRAQLEELKNLREQIASQSPDELRAAKTKAQLARIDAEIDGALDRRNFDLVKQLSDIKARLWPLCTPTAGVRKPGKSQDRRAGPTAPIG